MNVRSESEMKKKRLLFLFAGVLLLLLNSCGNWDPEIIKNRDNLKKIARGMSKAEVKAIMGEPLWNEVYNQPDLWFYYSDCKWSDGMITSDECTPVIFENGKVTGWGQDYYKNHCRYREWKK